MCRTDILNATRFHIHFSFSNEDQYFSMPETHASCAERPVQQDFQALKNRF